MKHILLGFAFYATSNVFLGVAACFASATTPLGIVLGIMAGLLSIAGPLTSVKIMESLDPINTGPVPADRA